MTAALRDLVGEGVRMNRDALLLGWQAARIAGVSRQALHGWRYRKHRPLIARAADGTPLPPDSTEVPRYRLGDVLDIERETRRSPWSKRPSPLAA